MSLDLFKPYLGMYPEFTSPNIPWWECARTPHAVTYIRRDKKWQVQLLVGSARIEAIAFGVEDLSPLAYEIQVAFGGHMPMSLMPPVSTHPRATVHVENVEGMTRSAAEDRIEELATLADSIDPMARPALMLGQVWVDSVGGSHMITSARHGRFYFGSWSYTEDGITKFSVNHEVEPDLVALVLGPTTFGRDVPWRRPV